MEPEPGSASYIPKACLSSCVFSSSEASIKPWKSSSPNAPSPSLSQDLTATCASSPEISPPVLRTQRCNSSGDGDGVWKTWRRLFLLD
ncbi:hypothetical protein Tsubulata_037369 [Turnera subulata]|uniref:Uncharacterized protein n=1 Tax=Turnera subulata TaxID=218843 RepID=A0A9Q0FSB0_9ROSI|nr:hypothetical protein Tsubulata_037369 [Turnera subulata]